MSKKNDELRRAVADTLQALDGLIEEISTLVWVPSNGMLPLICSGILRRQYECLKVAVDLVDKSQGFAAVGLLRPACEEYIWAKYLTKLNPDDVERLLLLIGRKEIDDSLIAQDEYAGREACDILGLTKYIPSSSVAAVELRRTEIRLLGKRLNWNEQTIRSAKLPSMAFLSKAVDEKKLYNFLYHASSRYVHFSVAELLRRSWGGQGKVRVSSSHFGDYWSAFVMYWGVYLLASTFPVVCKLGAEPADGSVNGELLLDAAERIRTHGPIPIITSDELAWETSNGAIELL